MGDWRGLASQLINQTVSSILPSRRLRILQDRITVHWLIQNKAMPVGLLSPLSTITLQLVPPDTRTQSEELSIHWLLVLHWFSKDSKLGKRREEWETKKTTRHETKIYFLPFIFLIFQRKCLVWKSIRDLKPLRLGPKQMLHWQTHDSYVCIPKNLQTNSNVG